MNDKDQCRLWADWYRADIDGTEVKIAHHRAQHELGPMLSEMSHLREARAALARLENILAHPAGGTAMP